MQLNFEFLCDFVQIFFAPFRVFLTWIWYLLGKPSPLTGSFFQFFQMLVKNSPCPLIGVAISILFARTHLAQLDWVGFKTHLVTGWVWVRVRSGSSSRQTHPYLIHILYIYIYKIVFLIYIRLFFKIFLLL